MSNTELQSVECLRVGYGSAAAADMDDEWRPAPPMQSPRTALGAAAVGQRIYAVGGQVALLPLLRAVITSRSIRHTYVEA